MHWGVDTLISSRQGPDAFQFQRISKILRGYCSWGEDRKRLEDEEEMKRWQAEIRRGRNKRESWKEELKARDGEHAVEENCMHVSFSCCMFLDNCVDTLTVRSASDACQSISSVPFVFLSSPAVVGVTERRSAVAKAQNLVPFQQESFHWRCLFLSAILWFCFRTQTLQKATLCLQKSQLFLQSYFSISFRILCLSWVTQSWLSTWPHTQVRDSPAFARPGCVQNRDDRGIRASMSLLFPIKSFSATENEMYYIGSMNPSKTIMVPL